MEDKAFPKYQWSEFCKNGKDGQLVVRSDDRDEFIQMLGQLEELKALAHGETAKPVTAPRRDSEIDEAVESTSSPKTLACGTCGEPATKKSGVSAKGRAWTGLFCSSGEKDHVAWL